ncbi:MAG: hypothetical protein JNL81_16640 [Hyphomonadaceae bacterium]|nr:hypothetical protein [Hyphomonadaceae bacterium]
MGSRPEQPTWRMLVAVAGIAALASMLGPQPIGPGPAYADECSELRAAIAQLDRDIANMGSGGASGGGSGGQVGALRDARNNYANAYNSMNCANGGLSSGGGTYGGGGPSDLERGLAAVQLGALVVDMFSSNNAEAERARQQEAARREAERQRLEADRRRAELERLAAEQRAADRRTRTATADPFASGGGQTSANPFATPFTEAPGGTLVAPNEGGVMSALARPVMQDLQARGVTGCPTGEPLANYCSIRPDWWGREQAGRAYSPSACVTYVQAVTNETPQCTARYRSTLARSQAQVRGEAAEIRAEQRCAANPFLEECQD